MSDGDRRFPFPPGIPLIALLVSIGAGRKWPLGMSWPEWTIYLGWLLMVVPTLFGICAIVLFRRNNTATLPRARVTALVTTGPMRFSRNPMYAAMVLAYAGALLTFRLYWGFVLLIPVILAFRYFVIGPEEALLRTLFGQDYVDYCNRVRRWI